MKKEDKRRSLRRIVGSIFIIIPAFLVLIYRLVIVQIVDANELSSKQVANMYSKISLTASRGDILDRNNNVLAMDATCSKVYVFPNSIDDAEATAKILSEKLSIDYNTLLTKISDTSIEYLVVKTGVDNQTALDIESADYSGVGTAEDKKRNYTDNSFAEYILGFTGSDHNGLYGIESVYNSVLAGEDGAKTILTDSSGVVIESSSTVKKEAKKGNNLVLTMDSVIQYYAESAAYEAYLKNEPKRIIIIVSEPSSGEILAMAAYPGYSLSDPWSVTPDYASSTSDSASSLGDIQLGMWSNPFTSFIYEPGSTFKLVTTSSALEENVINLNSTFYCSGSIEVSGVEIKCHIYPGSHGEQSLSMAMANSCNPALVQIANKMGADKFYKYIYNYGFGEKTGVDLDGEEYGILAANQNVNPVDFATLAFGQGLGVTPMQMVQALNATINGGKLIKPHVVKQIVDSNSGEVIHTYSSETIRQVISEETSAKMRQITYEVANSIDSIEEYQGLGILGKTGTAQKYVNGSYDGGSYVASFYGAIPYDDPKLSVLVVVDEPGGYNIYGSTVAAPIGAKVLANAYSYLMSKDQLKVSTIAQSSVVIPDVRGMDVNEAKATLDALNIKYTLSGDTTGSISDQNLLLVDYMEGMSVDLIVTQSGNQTVSVPNLVGMSVQNANELLTSLGLVLNADGGGIAVSQSIEKGTSVTKGTEVVVVFKYIE